MLKIDDKEYDLGGWHKCWSIYMLQVEPGYAVFIMDCEEGEPLYVINNLNDCGMTKIFYYSATGELQEISSFYGRIEELKYREDYDGNQCVDGFTASVVIFTMENFRFDKEYRFRKNLVYDDGIMDNIFRYNMRVTELPFDRYLEVYERTVLEIDLPIYKNIYGQEILTTLPVGSEVIWTATDGVEWMYVDSMGICGWVQFDEEDVIVNGEKMQWTDVFIPYYEAG